MARPQGQKIDWPARVEAARKAFPSIDALSSPDTARSRTAWHEALQDYDVLGKIMRDIIERDVMESDPTRRGPGRKPKLTREAGEAALARLTGQDYASEPFPVAFRALFRQMPLSEVAEKTGIAKTQIHRMLAGQRTPEPAELEQIATAFSKPPWYFAEYRVLSIVALLDAHLTRSPETSMAYFKRLGLDGRQQR